MAPHDDEACCVSGAAARRRRPFAARGEPHRRVPELEHLSTFAASEIVRGGGIYMTPARRQPDPNTHGRARRRERRHLVRDEPRVQGRRTRRDRRTQLHVRRRRRRGARGRRPGDDAPRVHRRLGRDAPEHDLGWQNLVPDLEGLERAAAPALRRLRLGPRGQRRRVVAVEPLHARLPGLGRGHVRGRQGRRLRRLHGAGPVLPRRVDVVVQWSTASLPSVRAMEKPRLPVPWTSPPS